MLWRLGDVKRGDLLGRWEAELGPESGSTRPLPNGWPGPRLGAAPALSGVRQTVGLDRPQVDGPRTGGERRQNAFFRAQGLFDLTTAFKVARQSSQR